MSQLLTGNQAKLASMVTDLHDLIYVANYMVEEGKLFEPPNAALSGLPTLYARVCHGLWGALGCVQTGALAETASTLRNLFEADISVQFILASPSDRSQLFGEFQTAQSYYNLKGIEEVEQATGSRSNMVLQPKRGPASRRTGTRLSTTFPNVPSANGGGGNLLNSNLTTAPRLWLANNRSVALQRRCARN